DNERPAGMLAERMDRADVWVIQSRCCSRLAQEPGHPIGVANILIRQELECDQAIQVWLARLIDNTHAAPSNLRDDLVTGDLWPSRRGQRRQQRRTHPSMPTIPGQLFRPCHFVGCKV